VKIANKLKLLGRKYIQYHLTKISPSFAFSQKKNCRMNVASCLLLSVFAVANKSALIADYNPAFTRNPTEPLQKFYFNGLPHEITM